MQLPCWHIIHTETFSNYLSEPRTPALDKYRPTAGSPYCHQATVSCVARRLTRRKRRRSTTCSFQSEANPTLRVETSSKVDFGGHPEGNWEIGPASSTSAFVRYFAQASRRMAHDHHGRLPSPVTMQTGERLRKGVSLPFKRGSKVEVRALDL